jgi:hypothetical protein
MKIFGQTLDTSILDTIRTEAASAVSRSALARKVCEVLGWKGANGKPKEMNARLLLNKLEKAKEVVLPPSRGPVPGWRPPEETDPLWQTMAEPFDGALLELGPLELVQVGTREESRLWNALFSRYHYLGKGPLCGAQVRYLAKSPVLGYVGGAAFSSASWKVVARDMWIGWDEEGRQKNLGKVVNNSRFLILPHIRVPHLASHLLGRLLRRLPSDWERLYGERPVLVETFVERERFDGTRYRAANFTEIGPTAGLGRKGLGTSVKTVFAYPFASDFRERLREGQTEAAPPVARIFSDWTEEEFGGVELGDARLGARCRTLAHDFYARPQASIPQACGGDRAKAKAAYRFFDHERATLEVLLEPHQKATIERMKAHPVVLCAQDTTELDYSGHPDTEGLGPIGNHKGGAQGLLLHDTVAFTPDGTPLGVVQAQTWVRPKEKPAPPPPKKRGRKPKNAPPEPPALPDPKGESEKWLASYREVARIQALLPGTRLVSVGDRESDFYELFTLATQDPKGPGLLVRAVKDRRTTEATELWESAKKQPASGTITVEIPRKGGRPGRTARLDVRYGSFELAPPGQGKSKGAAPVRLQAVVVTEIDCSEGTEPLEWKLLTTEPVDSLEKAAEVVGWYAKRWGIEVFHRTLKSGCRIEDRQLGNDHRLEACLAIDMVVAWRLFHLTKLGREIPDAPCTVFFEEAEWKALCIYHTKNPDPPETPPTLREAIRMTAKMGGFLGRKGDGEPGTEVLWKGLQDLEKIAEFWEILERMRRAGPTSPVPRRRRYG